MQRRKTRTVNIGGVCIGADNPVAIQSMCNVKGTEPEKVISQIIALEKAGCEIPRFDEIGCAGYPENVVRDVLQHLIVRGVISRVGDDIYAMTHYMDDVEAKIRAHFEKESLITFVQIKEMFGTSRKSAKFLAEYMDARKVTKKVGAETERVPYR